MGTSLTLLLLGRPELAIGGEPVAIRSAKSRALLCYLAATPGPCPRTELAGLLWGERPDANARGSLRLALTELRREVGRWLDISRDHVRFRESDGCFVDHSRLVRAQAVAEALRLWRGEFLDGVAFCDAPAFSCWLESERARVRSLLRDLLVRCAPAEPDDVVRLARVVTELDPYDEEAHRLLMTSLARAGNRAGALACYEELRRRLATELGVEPAPATQAVRRELAPPPSYARRAALPVPGTELIGRDADVRRLRRLLARERLVTLLGPGGVGKTRLAIAAAGAQAEAGFVSFAGVRAEAAVTMLARRLAVDLSPPRPALELLLSALAGRSGLLVLDNLEHLPAFDAVIGEILRVAPGVRILATSRRRLDVPGQAAVLVEGLPGPAAETLFAARALRARPAFDPVREAALVAAICATTGGLPLAIELAAGLLRAVPIEDLAQRLGLDPGLLSAAGPAARPRHNCMRTVFETSWHLLDAEGRQALAALSTFRNGCTLGSALEVARTTSQVLVQLVDHSMLSLAPSGRYVLHPLIQQFAASHLEEDPETCTAVRRRHAAHFARLLDEHATALQDASDTEVTRVLGPELDNIRLAWAASDQPRFLDHYWTLCLRLRLYEESGAVVLRHLARTRETPPLRARRLWMAAVSEHQLAREAEATRLAREALDTVGEPLPSSPAGLAAAALTAAARQAVHRLLPRVRADAAGPEAAQALTLLARLAYFQQDLPTMLAASLRQLNAAERGTDPALRAEAYANFTTIVRIAGRHRLATRYGALADRALAGIERPTDAACRARLARGLDQLHAGAFEQATGSFAEGRARTLDPRMAEHCAGMLAETALWRGDFAQAAELFAATEDLAVKRVGGDDIGRHWCLTGQAEALLRMDGVAVERIGEVLQGARASAERRRTHEKELGLRDGPVRQAVQEMRLLTLSARLALRASVEDPRGVARAALAEALRLADGLPAAQPGMFECWAGLAEVLWELAPWPDRTAVRRLHTHLTGYLSRTPGAAARIGWARALVLAAAGEERAAGRAALEAVSAAERLAVAYDHHRAMELARRLTPARN
ncbi:hypothetical protein E1295_43570 [Nonomuraea mesophila]|uniref:Bacterial transcriptional activator domain-containing protein n=1 Tax=Nonomuraea mesophila TaxID=2530382 RepID=A0A4R5E7U7_9ACTN|nr:BTAD domain-containing putative transcriptional regulator [Nonomuraea mesophila]TDE26912.1 hypothetical protein E1295_43570 [Nonomuraea mesophila]